MNELSAEGRAILDVLLDHNESGTFVPDRLETYLSYKDIHDILDLPEMGPDYGVSLQNQGLTDLANWTEQLELPTISSWIVNRSGDYPKPGPGFFNQFCGGVEDTRWWMDEVKRCVAWNWEQWR